MQKQCVNATDGPPAKGPYSHAVIAGDFVFVSGQGPFTAQGVAYGTFEHETRVTFANFEKVLAAAGCGLKDIVKVTVFLADMNDFAEFNRIYQEYFTTDCPARSCVQVGRLPLDIKVEIEAVAWRGTGD
ncbi:MAG TPA: Rid family detoxifying hydrolase [Candidatus Hydrogenedentes bacterium]|nr:Rid family detoxifying hydrolase [Candidatus Hydrogenedentota bacterium]HNT90073.1 Rid family detoxifying hydrolase [Candidatus Hydrogenedentota bacterium]